MMDEKKICFIICSNNQIYLDEALFYINRLNIPEGYSVDVLSIQDAKSMTSGYNEGMGYSDAKYKIYCHQDVFILYQNFLESILEIFHSDSQIGMIGMVGTKQISPDYVMWNGPREGSILLPEWTEKDYSNYKFNIEDSVHKVQAIDGLLMATAYDLPWREDLFDGWDFYDVSQSAEFTRAGYKIVVPEQHIPWCVHDDGILNLSNYNRYRLICMKEYPELVGKRRDTFDSRWIEKQNLNILIITHNQLEQLKLCIDIVRKVKLNKYIYIYDMNSDDKTGTWIQAQSDIVSIMSAKIESYSKIVNEMISQNELWNEDLLILNPSFMPAFGSIEAMKKHLKVTDAAAVGPVSNLFSGQQNIQCDNYAMACRLTEESRELTSRCIGLEDGALMVNQRIIRQKKSKLFDDKYSSPGYVIQDFMLKMILENEDLLCCKNAVFWGIQSDVNQVYYNIKAETDNRIELKKSWDMNYFNKLANYNLINMIEGHRISDKIKVLEIGCDCGATLLEIKNRYPNSEVYGLELNDQAVVIASHFANVKEGNIEENEIPFEVKFDYIIFGDVLEHLHNPQAVVENCRNYLTDAGAIIASIPNLMHYSVIHQLLNGYFTYEDSGLLDKTHIHFFTYFEICKMFQNAQYTIEDMKSLKLYMTEEEDNYSQKLTAFSGSEKVMFDTFQYVIRAKIDT